VQLYPWNASVAGALSEALGHAEVVLRSTLRDALTARHTRLGRPEQWVRRPGGDLEEHSHDDGPSRRP